MNKPQNEIDEGAWARKQRSVVEEYLRRQRVDHLGIGDAPAFSVPPYVALWAVQSKKSPGAVGWWAISGDLPTDYLSSTDARNPREAIRAFGTLWSKVAACMIRGEEYPNYSIGKPEQWPELGKLLSSRAGVLTDYAENDGIWQTDGSSQIE
jgi:hypothetical protein